MWQDLQQPLLERCNRIDMHKEGARALYTKLKRRLITAATEGFLKRGHGPVANLLRYIPAPQKEDLPHDLAPEKGWDYSLILGGEKVMRQESSGRQFERDDEAWFHFAITLREKRQALELVAYNFEIVFPGEHRGPRFVRFDLNPPAHQNDLRGMRSHMHPGIDEESIQGQVPAPVLDPTEALELFVNHLRWTRQ